MSVLQQLGTCSAPHKQTDGALYYCHDILTLKAVLNKKGFEASLESFDRPRRRLQFWWQPGMMAVLVNISVFFFLLTKTKMKIWIWIWIWMIIANLQLISQGWYAHCMDIVTSASRSACFRSRWCDDIWQGVTLIDGPRGEGFLIFGSCATWEVEVLAESRRPTIRQLPYKTSNTIRAGSQIEAGSPIQAGGFRSLVSIEAAGI